MTAELDWGQIGASIAVVIGTAGTAAVGFRKVVKKWASEGVEISKSAAERDIIENLRKEYATMSSHNATLIKEMQNLQSELLKLHQSVSELRIENQSLKTEIDRLQTVIDKLEKNTSPRTKAK